MVGMLQILTYLLAFYLIIKGIEVLQIGLASNRQDRSGPVILGVVVLLACVVAAVGFTIMQDEQAARSTSQGKLASDGSTATATASQTPIASSPSDYVPPYKRLPFNQWPRP
ncbi:hypothetical protein [Candidatus Binatus sp.]|uniref:hypothetical protein n=1 Tax=Candidatus Binatus sp. TaxID=2811406 RepID=UPI003C595D5F